MTLTAWARCRCRASLSCSALSSLHLETIVHWLVIRGSLEHEIHLAHCVRDNSRARTTSPPPLNHQSAAGIALMCAGLFGVGLYGIEATNECCGVFGIVSRLEEAASHDTSRSERS